MAAASISRVPTAPCSQVFRQRSEPTRRRCRRTSCMRSPSMRRRQRLGRHGRRRARARRRMRRHHPTIDSLQGPVARRQGLSSDTLYGIVPDARGDLWLSGNAGLMRFDPATGAVKTYHREHGLQGEEFAFGAHSPPARRPRRASAARAASISSIRRACPRIASRRALALTNVEVLGRACRRRRRRSGCATASRSTIAAASSRSISACSISLRRSTTASRIAWRA